MSSQDQVITLKSLQDFNEKLIKSEIKSAILVFSAEWCQPSKTLIAHLKHELEIQRIKLRGNISSDIFIPIFQVDIENEEVRDVVKMFSPQILPTCYLFEEGKYVAQFGGMDLFSIQKIAMKAYEKVAK